MFNASFTWCFTRHTIIVLGVIQLKPDNGKNCVIAILSSPRNISGLIQQKVYGYVKTAMIVLLNSSSFYAY